jgi:Methylmuconolactone methyl-isomerase
MHPAACIAGPMAARESARTAVSEPVRTDVPLVWDIGEVDGIAETWFDDQAATDRAFASPEGKRWLAHGASFIGRQKTFVVEEEVVIDLAPDYSS